MVSLTHNKNLGNSLTHNKNLETTLDSTPKNAYGKVTQTSNDLSNVLKYGDGSSRDAFLRYLDEVEAHFRG